MHRQADNLARAARALLDCKPGDDPLDFLQPMATALLAYDAARQDTLRLMEPAALRDADGFNYYAVRARGDTTGPLITVRCQYHDASAAPSLAAADLARRIAASVNLLARVPLDTLERLDTHSDAPAVLASKVRQMEPQP